jgi:hypothetical protein
LHERSLRAPQDDLFPGCIDGIEWLRNLFPADRAEFIFQEITNAAFQEKNAHRTCQNLRLSGENRFDGSVERAEWLEFSS